MAGDWIKMRGNLWDDPRVAKLCDLTGQAEAAIVGGLYWLWATADQHTEDGCMPGLTLRQIDRKTGIQGFGAALCAIDWLRDDEQGVVLVNFEEHNGASAKKRCQTAKRVASFKAGNALETPDQPEGNAPSVTEALAVRDLEKRREEEKDISKPTASHPAEPGRSPAGTIPCPYADIVSAYHDALPSLPKARLMPVKRQAALRKFWGWVLGSRKSDGTKRAETSEQALSWIAGYFARAGQNDFLMGRSARAEQHAGWQCDLDYLLSDKGLKQVIEKTREAA